MDPVNLILTALVSGAVASVPDTAAQIIKDSYAALKALISKKFQGNLKAEMTLQAHAEDPKTWEKPMAQAIQDAALDQNEEVLKMAKNLLELIKNEPGGAAKFDIDFHGNVQGVVQGDHAAVTMNFTDKPEPKKKK